MKDRRRAVDLAFGRHEDRTLTHGYAVDARRRGGGVRQELAAGVVQFKPTTEVEATSILPSLKRQDYSVAAWYPSLYAPRTGGAYDSHHRTAGILGGTRRRGSRVATRGAREAALDASDRVPQQRIA